MFGVILCFSDLLCQELNVFPVKNQAEQGNLKIEAEALSEKKGMFLHDKAGISAQFYQSTLYVDICLLRCQKT